MIRILILIVLLFPSSIINYTKLAGNKPFESNTNTNTQIKKTSKILFARKNDNEDAWSIYGVNPNGTEEHIIIPLKSGQGEYNPEIAPDGSSVLFNTYRFGGWKLATFNLKTRRIKRISPSSNYYTNGVFSPDGQRIAFERNVQRTTHIFISNKNGENEKNLTLGFNDENRAPSWSIDRKFVLFYAKKGNVNDIYRIDISSNKIENISKNNTGNDFNPSVSPDGKQVAFFSDRNGYLDLYVMDISGSNQVNLTSQLQNKSNTYNYYKDNNMFWIFKASWSPNGKQLVFSNVKSDNVDLFTIDANGENLTQITKTPESEFTPVWGLINL